MFRAKRSQRTRNTQKYCFYRTTTNTLCFQRETTVGDKVKPAETEAKKKKQTLCKNRKTLFHSLCPRSPRSSTLSNRSLQEIAGFLGGFLKPKITDFTAAVFCLKAFLGYKMREEVKTAIKESLSLRFLHTSNLIFFNKAHHV